MSDQVEDQSPSDSGAAGRVAQVQPPELRNTWPGHAEALEEAWPAVPDGASSAIDQPQTDPLRLADSAGAQTVAVAPAEQPADNPDNAQAVREELPGAPVDQTPASSPAGTSDDTSGAVKTVENILSNTVNINPTFITTQDEEVVPRVTVWTLPDTTIRRIEQIFVEPSGFARHCQDFSQSLGAHVAVIYGPRHSGKFTTAIRFGLQVSQERNNTALQLSQCRVVSDRLSLIDLVQQKEIGTSTIYIIEDALNTSIDPNDLSGIQLKMVNDELRKKNSYLLLTINAKSEIKEADVQVEQICSVVDDIGSVFAHHLKRYANPGQEESFISEKLRRDLEELSSTLLEHLKNPFQIDRFCARVSRIEPRGELIRGLAKHIGQLDMESPRHWFDQLHFNARLYAMVIVLFPGLSRLVLDEFYDLAVRHLREEGLQTLTDARCFGRDDLLELLNAHEEPIGDSTTIRFDNQIFEHEVMRQVRNYHSLLWSLHPLLYKHIDQFSGPQYWELRRTLGVALGRMGLYHRHKLELVLEQLARDVKGGVVATVGYTLDELCRAGPEWYEVVGALLERWAASKDFDLMWAVGASVWRVYETLNQAARGPGGRGTQQAAQTLQRLRTVLRELAGTYNQFNEQTRRDLLERLLAAEGRALPANVALKRLQVPAKVEAALHEQLAKLSADVAGSLIHALRQIAANDLAAVVDELRSWLKAEPDQASREGSRIDENRRLIAVECASKLFETYGQQAARLWLLVLFVQSQGIRPDDTLRSGLGSPNQRYWPLLDLIAPLLHSYALWLHARSRNLLRVRAALAEAFRMIRAWMSWPEFSSHPEEYGTWRDQIYGTLLTIVTRVEAVCAELLNTLVLEHLVGDLAQPPDTLRHMGQALIARICFMRGFPALLPEQREIVLLVDGSARGQAGQVSTILGWRLFTRLDPLVDVYLYQMGNCARLALPGQALCAETPAAVAMPVAADEPAPGSGRALMAHPLPRLVMPPLADRDPAHALCVLAVAWDIPTDLADLQESPWNEHLALVLEQRAAPGKTSPYAGWPPQRLVTIGQIANNTDTQDVCEQVVRIQIARCLAAFDAETWWQALGPRLGLASDCRDAIEARLTGWAQQIETVDDLNYRDSTARLLSCAILWLAAADLPACVALIERWLTGDSAPARSCGMACSRLLFHVYAQRPRPPLDRFDRLLRLAPHLGDQGWDDAVGVFEAAYVWAKDEAWVARLASAETDKSELMQLVGRLCQRPAVRQQLLRYLELKQWIRVQSQRRGRAPSSVVRLGEQIVLWAELGMQGGMGALTPDGRYGLVLIDASLPVDHWLRPLLAAAASALLGMLADEPLGSGLTLLAYQLGVSAPFASVEQKPAPGVVLPERLGRRPQLLGPLLEPFQPEQIAFVALLAAGVPRDAADWSDPYWAGRIHLAAIGRADVDHPFSPVALRASADEPARVASEIYQDLKRKIGVAAWAVSSVPSVSNSTT